MSKNVVADKSYDFALSVIWLFKLMVSERKEFILSKQLLRSGTSIGALVREAEHAQSMADFLHKMNISLKEANETIYWLQLLKDSEYIRPNEFELLFPKAEELKRLLVSIVKTSKTKLSKGR